MSADPQQRQQQRTQQKQTTTTGDNQHIPAPTSTSPRSMATISGLSPSRFRPRQRAESNGSRGTGGRSAPTNGLGASSATRGDVEESTAAAAADAADALAGRLWRWNKPRMPPRLVEEVDESAAEEDDAEDAVESSDE